MSSEGVSRARPFLVALSYVGFLGLFPLVFARRDREVQWHARNGLGLFLFVVAAGTAATLLGIAVPSLSCVYAVTMAIAGLLYVMIALLGAVKGLEGQRLMIPGVSWYASRGGR